MKNGFNWFNGQIIKAALLNGLVLNLLGWFGNALLLRSEWQKAKKIITPIDPLNFEGPTRELLTLAPDFIYGYLMIIVYIFIARSEGFNTRSKLLTVLISFFFGIFTTYLGITTSNLIPLKISVLTTLWGLLTFIPAFFLAIRLTGIDKVFGDSGNNDQ